MYYGPSLDQILAYAKTGKYYTLNNHWEEPKPRGIQIFDRRSDICRCVQKSLETLGCTFSSWSRSLESIHKYNCRKIMENVLTIDEHGLIISNYIYKTKDLESDTILLLKSIKELL